LDAYLLLRFTWLCLRICLFGTFCGMAVLAPLYYTQTGGIAKGFYQLVSGWSHSCSLHAAAPDLMLLLSHAWQLLC
jgi:Late exocytosis, associated with Golgi transport